MKSKYSLLLILAAVSAFGQTVLSPMPHQCFNDVLSQGKALSGGKLFTYQSGTSVPQASFTDSTGLVANSNPIILDAAGCASIWLTSGQAYSFVAQNSAGVQEWTSDNVSGLATASAAVSQAITTVAFSATPTFTALGQYQVFRMTLTGNVTSSSLVMTGVTVPSLVTFEITQDSTGNRSFTWPLGTGGALAVNSNPNSITTQSFFWDGTTAWALSNTYPQSSIVPVELFGAKGDWNGSSGTDDTAAIQACLNSLVVGQCLLGAKAYKVTGTLTIVTSGVGLIGVDSVMPNISSIPTTPRLSTIVSTSASADILSISGSSTIASIYGNSVKNLTLSRSVPPSGSAKGLSLSYSYKAQISNVASMDSIYDFYFRGVGSMGFGYIENNIAAWGYNGVTEIAGAMYGFFVDTSGGIFSPSIRLRNNHVANNLGHSGGLAWSTYGYATVGTLGADWHLFHNETATVDYGIYVNNSGGGFSSSSDIHILDSINDGCYVNCILITGLAGSVSITGGWSNSASSTTPLVDIENGASGSQVSLVNHGIFATSNTGSGAGLLAHNAYNVQIVGSKIESLSSNTPAIKFDTVVAGVISGNTIWDNTATTTLISIVNTINVPISNNVLNGSATNGIVLDSNSHGIVGLETNTCGASVATITNCEVDNGGNIQAFISGTLIPPVAFSALPTCNAGLEGAARAVNNSNTATYNATIAGGGTNHIPAYCNGTAWVAH